MPELRFPTQEEETADPGAADLIYSSAVEALKEQARGDELVEKEVTEYGFRRNLLGLKPYGILLCALGAALGIAQMGLYEFSHPSFTWLNDNAFKFSAVALSLGAVAAWTWFITKPWVFEAANQYARALLATCDRPRSAEGHAEAHTA
ncbi:MAG TPA: hypothetical protein VJ692_05165 [Nitrospiraceae bacterium]|nr:hypothetical protein [Nitrospiraceae bacterium]